jgi:hypothetical protein
VRLGAVAARVGRWLVFAGGSALLVRFALAAHGGKDKLWAFGVLDEHRFTAMSMLTGTLRLRNGVAGLANDEQIYNGAAYTNWGFGVPLLQMPFQALAHRMRSFSSGFFPDRAIFFGYLALLVPVLWMALSRVVAARPHEPWRTGRKAWSFAATTLLLTCALFPLMASRFYVYEETIAYLVVVELFALSAYVYAVGPAPAARAGTSPASTSLVPVILLGVAAGVGLLVRVTGLGYLGLWFLLVLLERRTRAAVVAFVGGCLPSVAFWLVSNRIRTGSPVSPGYANSIPWHTYHIPIQRFGSQCADTLKHAGLVARELLHGFFVGMENPTDPHLAKCHYEYEVRTGGLGSNEPAFSAGVLLVLAWILVHHVARRERRLAIWLPFAALAVLFADYAYAGMGFVWRYAGDFWPIVALVVVQYVRGIPREKYRGAFGFRAALVLGVLAYVEFHRNVTPAVSKIETLDDKQVAALADRFSNARWGMDHNLSPRLECAQSLPSAYYRGREGWTSACKVETYTTVYLGVPDKGHGPYELRLETHGLAAPVRVYVNGRFYSAVSEGDRSHATVDIDYAALTAPTVLVTIEWVRGFDAPEGTLDAIELV